MNRSHTEPEGSENNESAKNFEEMLTEAFKKEEARPAKRHSYKTQKETHRVETALAHSPGDTVSGKITRIETFGAFVEISPGIEGLLHISEISWERVKDVSALFKVGDSVKTKLLNIDQSNPGKLKISLSIKQLQKSPWDDLAENFHVGKIVKGKVSRCVPFGAFVELLPGVDGLIPMSQFTDKLRIKRAEEIVTEGEEISVMIKEINLEGRRISLSLKDALNVDASASEQEDIRSFQAQQEQQLADSGAGDMAQKLKAALEKKDS